MTADLVEISSQNHNIAFGNDLPLVLIAGINVLEDESVTIAVAEELQAITSELNMPWVFKASFDKANRSSIQSYRGPGLEKGLEQLAAVKQRFNCPIITDIHTEAQARPVADVADILQIPAFLSRQTDLIQAACEAGKPINIKKAQYLAPNDMQAIIAKCKSFGHNDVMLCERGTVFGYNNLVVDPLGIPIMKAMAPLIFDVTHALQLPGARSARGSASGSESRSEGVIAAGGRGASTLPLAKSYLAQGIAGLFLELHPDPARALCDGPSALPLSRARSFLQQVHKLDRFIKTELED